MGITSFNTDYTGRQKDISIFRGQNFQSSNPQPVKIVFGNPSQFCAGIQKLVQRFAVLFLTNLGSQTNYPAFGTNFPTAVGINNNISSIRFTHLFNFASLSVLNTLRNYQAANPDLPLDEQINSVILQSFSSTPTSISCTIKIVSNAGDNFTFLLPIPNGN